MLQKTSKRSCRAAGRPDRARRSIGIFAEAVVGRWRHGRHGDVIGSVRGLADGGRTAVIMAGAYVQPGSHEAQAPARALSVVDGKITLRAGSLDALNARSRW